MDKLEDIIKGCIHGRSNSQKELYELYSGRMFSLCLRYSRDRTEAEDTLLEAFMKVFDNIGKFKHEGSFEGWMRRIMINTALGKIRRQNLLYPLVELPEHHDAFSSDDVILQVSAEELLLMIKELSTQYRIVFNLFAIEGYSHKEISSMLGISESTSKSNLSRARMILQNKVKVKYNIKGLKNKRN